MDRPALEQALSAAFSTPDAEGVWHYEGVEMRLREDEGGLCLWFRCTNPAIFPIYFVRVEDGVRIASLFEAVRALPHCTDPRAVRRQRRRSPPPRGSAGGDDGARN